MRVERGENPLAHIGLEALVGVALVGIDPGDDEHRQALRHRPADEGFFGIEVEHVELVDPRRHDQQRPLVDARRRRRVLDELHQFVAKDHLAGRRGEIDAELELLRVGLTDAQIAVSRRDILGHHLQPAHEILAAFGERRAQQLGVGGEEVRRRQRARHLTQIELRLVARVRVEIRRRARRDRWPSASSAHRPA